MLKKLLNQVYNRLLLPQSFLCLRRLKYSSRALHGFILSILSILIKQVIVYLSFSLFVYGRPNRKA